MQAQVQTQTARRLVVLVSGGELIFTIGENGKRKFFWNAHPISKGEFLRIIETKRAS